MSDNVPPPPPPPGGQDPNLPGGTTPPPSGGTTPPPSGGTPPPSPGAGGTPPPSYGSPGAAPPPPPPGYGSPGATPAPPPAGSYGQPGMGAPYGQPMGGAPAVQYSPIEAVKYGWEKFTQNWAPWVVAIVVYFVAIGLIGFLFSLIVSAMVGGSELRYDAETNTYVPSGGLVAGLGIAFFLYTIVLVIIAFLASAQLARAGLENATSGRIDYSVFTRTVVLGTLLLAALLVGIFTSIGIILCVLPGLIVAFMLQFYAYPILDGSAQGAMGGIKASWNIVTKNFGNVILYVLVVIAIAIVVGIVNLILAFIPILGWIISAAIGVVLIPVLAVAHAYTYRTLTGQGVAR